MNTMRYKAILAIALFSLSLAAMAAPSAARTDSNPLLDDVVQMSRAGLSDATIIAYLRARTTRLAGDVEASDLIRLQRAGVHEAVVEYIAGAAGLESAPMPRVRNDVTYDSGDVATPAEPSDEDVSYGSAEAYPYYGWYGWYGYPYWYAYSPFFAGGVVIRGGGGFFHGHRFSSRPFRGGGFSRRGGSFGGRSVGGHSSGGHGRR